MAPARLSVVEPLLWIAAAIGLALLPLVLSIFQVVQITVFLIFCLLAVSLDLSWGLAGLLSFGQAAFFGIGCYSYAIIGINGTMMSAATLAAAAAGAAAAATNRLHSVLWSAERDVSRGHDIDRDVDPAPGDGQHR
jgi:ABC-type branched-subunit amino acid transport system permease subunit